MWYKLLIILLFLFLVAGCTDNNNANLKDYYLSLMGEGQHWRVKGYEIEITGDSFMAGNGFLDMKNEDSYMTDSFDIEVRAVIDNIDQVIQKSDRKGETINIAAENTGEIMEDRYVDQEGNPITLEDIKKVYLVLKWHDLEKKKNLQERINLYQADEHNIS